MKLAWFHLLVHHNRAVGVLSHLISPYKTGATWHGHLVQTMVVAPLSLQRQTSDRTTTISGRFAMLVDWYVADVHIPFIIRDGKTDLFPSQISSFVCDRPARIRPQYSHGHAPVSQSLVNVRSSFTCLDHVGVLQ
jgi:hypothetical protein